MKDTWAIFIIGVFTAAVFMYMFSYKGSQLTLLDIVIYLSAALCFVTLPVLFHLLSKVKEELKQ